MAAIVACESVPEGSEAILYSDSKYVVNTMSGAYDRNKNHDLWRRLDTAVKGKRIKWKWTRGHAGDIYNERCDSLATEAHMSAGLPRDLGYNGPVRSQTHKESSGTPGGAMGIRIDALKEEPPHIKDVKAYAARKGTTYECARQLKALYSTDKRTFRAYAAIKTGGLDSWSKTSLDELEKLFPKSAKCAEEVLGYGKSLTTALRWVGRGMTTEDAIRKVLVDKEVSENAMRKYGRI